MHQDLPHDRILAQEGHGLHGRCRQFTVDVELAIVSRDDPNSVAGSREDLGINTPMACRGGRPRNFESALGIHLRSRAVTHGSESRFPFGNQGNTLWRCWLLWKKSLTV